MELITEEQTAIIAGKVLAKITDKIKSDIGDAFYQEYSNYLYEHYLNNKDKIDEGLIAEITDKFIKDPAMYKYRELRDKIYHENKTGIDKKITEEVITKGVENVILAHTSDNYFFNWKWKDGIVATILSNWDRFKDDERIKEAFVKKINNLIERINYLENQLKEILVSEDE